MLCKHCVYTYYSREFLFSKRYYYCLFLIYYFNF